MKKRTSVARRSQEHSLLVEAIVVGSDAALEKVMADHDVESFIELLVEAVAGGVGLSWPHGASLESIARFARQPDLYSREAPSVSPMLTEAILRAVVGDRRAIIGLGPEILIKHLAVALRLLVENLVADGLEIPQIVDAAVKASDSQNASLAPREAVHD